MKMGGMVREDAGRDAEGMMDEKGHALIGAPALMRGRRIGVSPAQSRPPFRLEPRLEGARIRRTDDIAAGALPVLDDEGTFGREPHIGRGIDMANEAGIGENGRRVLAIRAGFQGDCVDGVQVVRPDGTDIDAAKYAPLAASSDSTI